MADFCFAKRIVAAEGVKNAEKLTQKRVLQIGLNETDCVCFRGGAYVILDFGKELVGGVRILTFQVNGNKKVRLRFGESVAETCSEVGTERGFWKATNDHSLRDFCVELQNYSDMRFAQTGFRFLRIDFLSGDGELYLKTAVAVTEIDERPFSGSFECDDALVNEIWNTAAYTLRLCLQNGYFWDGVKRDRLVWIGDLYPEMKAAHYLYGDVPETVNSLDFVKAETPLPKWMNNIPSYSLWWLLILAEEYAVYGEKPIFNTYLPYVNGLLLQISDYVTENGKLLFEWNFVDWPTNYAPNEPIEKKTDSETGVAYLMKLALTKLLPFLEDHNAEVSVCKDVLRRLDKRENHVEKYKQIAALGVWSGDNSDQNREILLREGAKGLSTFTSYPILSAIASYGQQERALQVMKEYYGGMLSLGATTFWEDFDLDWLHGSDRIDEMPKNPQSDAHGSKGAFCYVGYRHSLCHGWSAGVVPYLIETVVGIKTEGAGMRRIKIQPNLSGLKYLKATVPTPYGDLTISCEEDERGNVKTEVFAPDEIEIEYA